MHKIVFIYHGTFSKRDYKRFGIDILKKNFSVKILDFTPWTYPKYWKKNLRKIYKCTEHVIIKNKKDFFKFDDQKDPLIVIEIHSDSQEMKWAKKQLKMRKSLFVGLDIAIRPMEKFNFFRSLKKIIKSITKPKKFFFIFYNYFQKRYDNLNKQNQPDFLVLGGLSSARKFKVKNKIEDKLNQY